MAEIRNKIIALKSFMDSQIIGQEDLVNKLIITLWRMATPWSKGRRVWLKQKRLRPWPRQ